MADQLFIVDDDPVFSELLKANLRRIGGFEARVFADPFECLEALNQQTPQALITDLRMPGMDGVELTTRVRAEFRHLPILVVTAFSDIDTAIEALKAGANEYLRKPLKITELAVLLRKTLADAPLLAEAEAARARWKERSALEAILGSHPEVAATRDFGRRVAQAPDATVLLLGESGVGKNLLARAIHQSDPTRTGRFIEVNCGAIPETLIEAELFGYVKGAFTDARQNKEGLIEAADRGTLFLDEIAELPGSLQVKLLGFLESRRVRRLGGTREFDVSTRVVAATNRDLHARVSSGDFREDLFYRIAVATHTVPPLRKIISDLPLIAEHILHEFNSKLGKKVEGLEPEALDALAAWHWPGNVRELRNVLERAMIFATGKTLTLGDLPPMPGGKREPVAEATFPVSAGLTLKEAEAEYIRLTLERHHGGVAEVAASLGISRKNLWERRKRHGIS